MIRSIAAAVVVALGVAGLAQAQPAPAADPAAPAVAQTPAEAYAAQFGAAEAEAIASPGRKDDVQVAEQVLEAARQLPQASAGQALYCSKAYALASRTPEGYPVAAAAARLWMESPAQREEAIARLIDALTWMGQTGTPDARSAAREELLETLVSLGDADLAAARAAEAAVHYRKALPIAVSLRIDRRQAIDDRVKAAMALQVVQGRAQRLAEAIAAGTAEEGARRQLLQIHLVELGDFAAAAALIDDAVWDMPLRTYLPMAARDPAQLGPAGWLELARWLTVVHQAGGRASSPRLLARAQACYERYRAIAAAGGEGTFAQTDAEFQALQQSIRQLSEPQRIVAGLRGRGGLVRSGPRLKPGFPRDDEQASRAARAMLDQQLPADQRQAAFQYLRKNVADYEDVKQLLLQRCRTPWAADWERDATLQFALGRYGGDADVTAYAGVVVMQQNATVIMRTAALKYLTAHCAAEASTLGACRVKLGQRWSAPHERHLAWAHLAAQCAGDAVLAELAITRCRSDWVVPQERIDSLAYLAASAKDHPQLPGLLKVLAANRNISPEERLAALGHMVLLVDDGPLIRETMLLQANQQWPDARERVLALTWLSQKLPADAGVRKLMTDLKNQPWRTQPEQDLAAAYLNRKTD